MRYKEGQRITFLVMEGTVSKVSDAHGLCYEVALPRKDFNHPRRIFIDETEVVNLYKVEFVNGGKPWKIWLYAQSEENAVDMTTVFIGEGIEMKATKVKCKIGHIVAIK